MKDKLYNCFYSAFRQSHEARISCAMKDKLYNCFYSAFRQSHDAHISAHLERHRPPALLRQPRRPLPTQHFILRIPICVNAGSRAPAALLHGSAWELLLLVAAPMHHSNLRQRRLSCASRTRPALLQRRPIRPCMLGQPFEASAFASGLTRWRCSAVCTWPALSKGALDQERGPDQR